VRDLHIVLPDETGRHLEVMAKVELRSMTSQVAALIETEWALGQYADDGQEKAKMETR
jgi:hypothetical protein